MAARNLGAVAALARPGLLLNGALIPRQFHPIDAKLARCLPRADAGARSLHLASDPFDESRGVSRYGARLSDAR